jgi:hypothetical protein
LTHYYTAEKIFNKCLGGNHKSIVNGTYKIIRIKPSGAHAAAPPESLKNNKASTSAVQYPAVSSDGVFIDVEYNTPKLGIPMTLIEIQFGRMKVYLKLKS